MNVSNANQQNDAEFHCVVKCDSRQKVFKLKEELDLHMKFFHEAGGPSVGPQ